MENLKKVLRLTELEFADSLIINHEEFKAGLNSRSIGYKTPNRFINIFYRIPNSAFQQILIQLLLLSMWGGIGFGVYLFIKKLWLFGIIALVVAFVIKKISNIIILYLIKRALISNNTFYDNLLNHKIIGIYQSKP